MSKKTDNPGDDGKKGDDGQDPENPNPAPDGKKADDGAGDDGQGGSKGQPDGKKADGDPDGSENWTAEQWKAHALELRKENAKRRTENKTLKDEVSNLGGRFSKLETGLKGLFGEGEKDLTPEEQVAQLKARNEELEAEKAISDLADANGVSGDAKDYFRFLVETEAGKLKDNEELSEEQIAELATKAKGVHANPSTSPGGGDGKKNGGKPPGGDDGGGSDDVTLDDFVGMNMGEKTLLFQKNKDLYNKLQAQARKEKRLV